MKAETYLVPDFNKWNRTKVVTEKPKVSCEVCTLNGWCVYAPWVSGCDSGEIDEDFG